MVDDEKREMKMALRRECFAAVRELGDAQKTAFSTRICEYIRMSAEFRKAASVGIYIAAKSEPDLGELIWNCPEKVFSLARIGGDGTLHFHRIESEGDLVVGEFGIAEPNVETCPVVAESELDLVLVPGVAFDPASGARLGRGKGHYDRFLERLRGLEGGECSAMGVSFNVQHRVVVAENHDQPMDFLVSEVEMVAEA